MFFLIGNDIGILMINVFLQDWEACFPNDEELYKVSQDNGVFARLATALKVIVKGIQLLMKKKTSYLNPMKPYFRMIGESNALSYEQTDV